MTAPINAPEQPMLSGEVLDVPQLLDTMMSHLHSAPTLYRPTNYWQVYEGPMVSFIRKTGVSGFRSDAARIFAKLGVTYLPETFTLRDSAGANRLSRRMIARLSGVERNFIARNAVYARTFKAWQNTIFKWIHDRDTIGSLTKVADSGLGQPTDLFKPDLIPGAPQYTTSFLRYYEDFRWMQERTGPDKRLVMFELGAGYGGMAELVTKVFPDTTYVICDIPPALYVAEQYLKAVFPGKIHGYKADSPVIVNDDGMIHLMQPYQLPDAVWNVRPHIFFTCNSLQEMEPTVVENYLSIVQDLGPAWVHLIQKPEGSVTASQTGEYGVIKKVTRSHYIGALHKYDLSHEEKYVLFFSEPNGGPYIDNSEYHHMLFKCK